MSYKPIRDYGLVGNMRTAALIATDGDLDWLCWPRFDSPSVFAGLLDDERGGRFRLTLVGGSPSGQQYRARTNILETSMEGPGGTMKIIDFMVPGRQVLYRLAICESGSIEVAAEFSPAPNFGQIRPERVVDDGSISVDLQDQALVLTSQCHWLPAGDGAEAVISLAEKEQAVFVLSDSPQEIVPEIVSRDLQGTEKFWTEWLDHCRYSGPWSEQVERSALTIKALTYDETGLMVAAPTTSLPEAIGGDKNWDYRYAWLRDSSMILEAMFHLGHMAEEGESFVNFLAEMATADPSSLKIMYGIDGVPLTGKEVLPVLDGYMGSKPVRIGNAASSQLQLDVYGEALLTCLRYVELVKTPSKRLWPAVAALANHILTVWREPDMGIWEERGRPRHYTHSKMMCAVGLRSAIATARLLGISDPPSVWEATAKEITQAVMDAGWNDEVGAFTKVFNSTELDAGALLMSVYGFINPNDPRMRLTVDKIVHSLGSGGLVYRFQWPSQSLEEGEGAFSIASLWLAIYFMQIGKLDFAADYVQAIADSFNHVGLISEEIDPSTGEFLGNFPQLFVHAAFIDAVHLYNSVKYEDRPAH